MFYLSAHNGRNQTMSLVKTYAVACEGVVLADRLRNLGRLDNVHMSFHDHQPFSGYATSSQRARRLALKNGWSRVTRSLPIFPNKPTAGSTDIKFDLCPSCTEQIGDN
jgi:hypothetical protein